MTLTLPESGREDKIVNQGDSNRQFGLMAGRALIRALGCVPSSQTSNEFMLGKKRAVMKSARKANAVEVTYGMMERLDVVIAAILRSQSGATQEFGLYRLDVDDFRDMGKQGYKPNQHRLTTSKIRKAAEYGRVEYLGTEKIRVPK